ncbi:MAG: nucleotide exchange factor GrpE [Deltaproteobacteria bacterium]|nr:nucleotide exchange factor GrpE [Deltaproteobacteria bacterium]
MIGIETTPSASNNLDQILANNDTRLKDILANNTGRLAKTIFENEKALQQALNSNTSGLKTALLSSRSQLDENLSDNSEKFQLALTNFGENFQKGLLATADQFKASVGLAQAQLANHLERDATNHAEALRLLDNNLQQALTTNFDNLGQTILAVKEELSTNILGHIAKLSDALIQHVDQLAQAITPCLTALDEKIASASRRERRAQQALEFLASGQTEIVKKLQNLDPDGAKNLLIDFADNFTLWLLCFERSQSLNILSNKFNHLLECFGLTVIAEPNVAFDPDIHRACDLRHDSHLPNDTVVEIVSPGFYDQDKLLRPAMVVINRWVEESDNEDEDYPEQDESEQDESEQDESDQDESEQDESDQDDSDQDDSDQDDSEYDESEQDESDQERGLAAKELTITQEDQAYVNYVIDFPIIDEPADPSDARGVPISPIDEDGLETEVDPVGAEAPINAPEYLTYADYVTEPQNDPNPNALWIPALAESLGNSAAQGASDVPNASATSVAPGWSATEVNPVGAEASISPPTYLTYADYVTESPNLAEPNDVSLTPIPPIVDYGLETQFDPVAIETPISAPAYLTYADYVTESPNLAEPNDETGTPALAESLGNSAAQGASGVTNVSETLDAPNSSVASAGGEGSSKPFFIANAPNALDAPSLAQTSRPQARLLSLFALSPTLTLSLKRSAKFKRVAKLQRLEPHKRLDSTQKKRPTLTANLRLAKRLQPHENAKNPMTSRGYKFQPSSSTRSGRSSIKGQERLSKAIGQKNRRGRVSSRHKDLKGFPTR